MIEVRIIHNISETTLADMLNAGWTVMHMQFIEVPAGYKDTSVERLNVVLQYAVADEYEDSLWDDEDEVGGFPSTYSGEDDDEDDVPPAPKPPRPAINPDEIPF